VRRGWIVLFKFGEDEEIEFVPGQELSFTVGGEGRFGG
jgi:hypothetical protein